MRDMYTVDLIEYNNEGEAIKKETMNYHSMEEAWKFFRTSITEHFHKDFWDYFNWNDEVVESVHYDESGSINCILHKWEDFDKYVFLSWQYQNVFYDSLEELWNDMPEFQDCFLYTDRPFIYSIDYEKRAWLNADSVWDTKEDRMRQHLPRNYGKQPINPKRQKNQK